MKPIIEVRIPDEDVDHLVERGPGPELAKLISAEVASFDDWQIRNLHGRNTGIELDAIKRYLLSKLIGDVDVAKLPQKNVTTEELFSRKAG